MPALKNLIGERFGKLVVISKAPSKNKAVYWNCQCDCGNFTTVKAASLTQGKTHSCGCLYNETRAAAGKKGGTAGYKDLVGQRFGKLVVLNKTDLRASNGAIIWHCQCDCGNQCDVSSGQLLKGETLHCGCEQIHSKGEFKIAAILKENNISFEQEKTFESCRFPETNQYARFDFYVNNKYLIEYDGETHFVPHGISKSGWHTEDSAKYIQKHDNFKNNWCKENNIPLIRIPYTHFSQLCLNDLQLETSSYIV